jgi:hypothetical protein
MMILIIQAGGVVVLCRSQPQTTFWDVDQLLPTWFNDNLHTYVVGRVAGAKQVTLDALVKAIGI